MVKNETGYKNLIHLSSLSYLNKGSDVGISISDLEGYSDGLFCFLGGEFNPLLILNNQNKKNDDLIKKLQQLFKNNLFLELQRISDSELDAFEDQLINISNEFNIPLIGTNNIKFGEEEDFQAHDALLCVAQKTTINSGSRKTSNNQIAFKSSQQMIEALGLKAAKQAMIAAAQEAHKGAVGAIGLANFDYVHLGLIDNMAMFADPFAASGQ